MSGESVAPSEISYDANEDLQARTIEVSGGMMDLFKPIVFQYSAGLDEIGRVQQQLESRVEALHAELQGALELCSFPDAKTKLYIEKLANLKKRIATLSSTVVTIRQRTSRIHATLAQRHRNLSSTDVGEEAESAR